MTLFVYSHICFPIDVHFVTAVAVMVMSISDVLFPNVFGSISTSTVTQITPRQTVTRTAASTVH